MASQTLSRPSLAQVLHAVSPIHLARAAALIVFCVIWVRIAWICDDAFITMRVVDNFVNGYGLVWNTDERVQAYTHPLWFLLLSLVYLFIREPYYAILAVSAMLSIGTVLLVLRTANTVSLVILAGILLTGSKAFVEFSSSGLENPLTHFLLIAFSLLYIRARQQQTHRNNTLIAALAGLTLLNRLDLALFVLPAVTERILSEKTWTNRGQLAALVLGPTALWTIFSVIYYGFPFPNTFYAKQTANIPRAEYLERGVAYIIRLATHDPLTFVVIAAGVLIAFTSAQRSMFWTLGAGMLAYSSYTVWIGGDFMQGRFFSAAFVLSVILVILTLDRLRTSLRVNLLLSSAAIGLGMLTIPVPNWLSSHPYSPQESEYARANTHPLRLLVQRLNYPRLFTLDLINDERFVYYAQTGLLSHLQAGVSIRDFWGSQAGEALRQSQARVTVYGMIGFFGFFAGPEVTIIDHLALSDAFVARLPYQGPGHWSPGHLPRSLPDGYVSSRMYGENRVSNAKLRQLYEDLRIITQGPLLSWDRVAAIVRLNLFPPKVSAADLQPPARDLVQNQVNRQLHTVPPEGLLIYTSVYSLTLPEALFFLADSQVAYQIELTNDRGDPSAMTIVSAPANSNHPIQGLSARLIELRSQSDLRFNMLRVRAAETIQPPQFGHLRFLRHTSGLSTEQSRLLGAGVTLSTAVGLASWFSAPLPIVMPPMAGVWYSATGTDELQLQIQPASCQHQASLRQAVLIVNGQRLREFKWDSGNCQPVEFTAVLSSPMTKEGWNLLEIHVDEPHVIAVEKLRLQSVARHP